MGEYYDALETRDPEQREQELMAALPRQIAHAKANAPAFARLLDKVRPEDVKDRRALADLPVIRKSQLSELQHGDPPFGGLAAVPPGSLARIFASPGPIYEPEAHGRDYWRLGRALYAAGFRAGEIVHNTFSYHLTPAGSMLETGAHAIGCAVIPGGVGQTEQQVRAIADLKPHGYVGTPSFLRILLAKGKELDTDTSSLRKALLSGEAYTKPMREEFAAGGITAVQCYVTADIGLIAYESVGSGGEGMILDENLILEIVRPGTNTPVPPGEVGEVVITTLTPEYPMIRFGTGDLSALLPGHSPCGRTNYRIKGWMGRADQSAKIKGMFVHPPQIAEIVNRHKEIIRARLVVTRDAVTDIMTLKVEMGEPAEDTAVLAQTLQSVTKLRGSVEIVPQGSLPNDGKVIDDQRKYD